MFAYAFQSMALAGLAVPRSPLPLPIAPRCESGRYPDSQRHGQQQCDHHCDYRDKGFGHRGSPLCLCALSSTPPSSDYWETIALAVMAGKPSKKG
jgi:hypothetical protein